MGPDEMNVKIGEFVRDRRKERGWSMEAMVHKMAEYGIPNLHPMTIHRVERGERPLRIQEAYALVDIFGCKLDDMTSTSEPERGNYQVTVSAFAMTEWQSEALFTRVADAAHARDEEVTCTIGPLCEECEDDT